MFFKIQGATERWSNLSAAPQKWFAFSYKFKILLKGDFEKFQIELFLPICFQLTEWKMAIRTAHQSLNMKVQKPV
jgi:hypothetical protein